MEPNGVERSIGRLEGKLDSVLLSVGELKASFDQMEKGRLSKLEVQFATMETELSIKTRYAALIYSLIASVIASVISAAIIYVLVPHMA